MEFRKEINMWIVILLLSIFIFLKTIGYGFFELKKNNNRIGGIIIIILSFFSLIMPTVITMIRD